MILATTPGIQDARTNRRFLMTDSPYNFFMGIDPSPSPPVRRPFFEISVVDDAQEHNTECPTLKVVPATPPLETDRSTITEGLEELHRQKHTSTIGKIAKTGKKNARRIFHSTSSPKLPKSSMKHKGQTEKENRGSDDTPNPKKNRKVKFQLGSLDNQSTLSQDTLDTVTTSSPKEKKSSEESPFPHSGALDVKFESLGRHSTTSQVSQVLSRHSAPRARRALVATLSHIKPAWLSSHSGLWDESPSQAKSQGIPVLRRRLTTPREKP